ncbi:MAG: hypothetical protein IJU31_06025, partial [Synergistaceae bacterium]|nr:hypothetical protein [Synergistaceae bacterium]
MEMSARNIKRFIQHWNSKGKEKGEAQSFWLDLLRDVLDVEDPSEFIEFEKTVDLEHKSFIDAYIPSTRVIIEQKGRNISLSKSSQQSDGTFATPFEQAKRYNDWLPTSQRAQWIITCNFHEFQLHDMEKPRDAPVIVKLSELEKDWPKLSFIVNTNATKPKDIHELEISVKAAELVGKLYKALESRYRNSDSDEAQRSLTVLCVRIVFLLYAEDSELFDKAAFHDYLLRHSDSSRRALIDLFTVLSQEKEHRDPYIDSDLMAFPYVNGGLFEEQNIEIPQLNGEPLDIILRDMSEGFDWTRISPTIFGALFESILNKENRRKGGMHYTSIENIHKVIDPLFLDSLKAELEDIMNMPQGTPGERGARTRKMNEFQKNLGSLTFLDPACGSGNFLTETYLSLRRLENQILRERRKQLEFVQSADEVNDVKVSIGQFFGIEINDFAVAVARTALWIAEAQMWNETKQIVHNLDDYLPLKSYNNIIEANALKFDWAELIEPGKLNFIMGNPPFRGARIMDENQKAELNEVFAGWKNAGNLDYVSCWSKKAADMRKDPS